MNESLPTTDIWRERATVHRLTRKVSEPQFVTNSFVERAGDRQTNKSKERDNERERRAQ